MRNKIYKSITTAMLLALIIGINSCRKERHQNDSPSPVNLEAAKNYVNNHLSKASSNVFSRMGINWGATSINEQPNETVIEVSLSNSERIFQTNALIEQVGNNEKRNNIRLIVFKDNATDKINHAVYMSIINDGELMDLTKISYKRQNTLTGKILFYDLEGGFINGWHYSNGKIDQSISPSTKEAYKQSQTKINIKLSASKSSNIGNDNKISKYDLPEMICHDELVPTYGVACVQVANLVNCNLYQTGSTYVSYCEFVDQGGGSGGGTAPGGSGNNSNSGTTLSGSEITEATLVDDGKKAIDPQKYIDCFSDGKQAKSYKMTIYVDQPVPGKNSQYSSSAVTGNGYGGLMLNSNGSIFNVGHTFVGFEKMNMDGTSVKQFLGFYPSDNPFKSKGIIKDDSGHGYNVSYTKEVTQAQFGLALTEVLNNSKGTEYVLANYVAGGTEYNCTDAAVNWMSDAGIQIPFDSPRGLFTNTQVIMDKH